MAGGPSESRESSVLNPYAPPSAPLADEPPHRDARVEPIASESRHAVSIRAMGELHLLVGVCLPVAIPSVSPSRIPIVCIAALLNLVVGFGLVRLRAWSRWLEVLFMIGVLCIAGESIYFEIQAHGNHAARIALACAVAACIPTSFLVLMLLPITGRVFKRSKPNSP